MGELEAHYPTEANHVIHDNQLVRGCIVRVKSYQANEVKGKKYVLRNPSQEALN